MWLRSVAAGGVSESPRNAMPSRHATGAIPTGKVCNFEQTAAVRLRYASLFF